MYFGFDKCEKATFVKKKLTKTSNVNLVHQNAINSNDQNKAERKKEHRFNPYFNHVGCDLYFNIINL